LEIGKPSWRYTMVEISMANISKKVALALMLGVAGFAGSAEAANLVQNGGFETVTAPNGSGQLNFSPNFMLPTSAANWTSATTSSFFPSYNILFLPGDNTAAARAGNVSLYAPAGPDTLPGGGGNFIASDPQFDTGPLSQTIVGLTVGASYTLTFDYAGAQQLGFDGVTTGGWQVSLGSETHNTATLTNANHGFTGWFSATMNFTATSTSEVLSFLATGGPSGTQPPFVLLDNVSLDLSVPEPMTLSVFGIGLVGAAAWKRRKASKKA
jgi:hypothetical protein